MTARVLRNVMEGMRGLARLLNRAELDVGPSRAHFCVSARRGLEHQRGGMSCNVFCHQQGHGDNLKLRPAVLTLRVSPVGCKRPFHAFPAVNNRAE
jgi:hypothetical protein